METKSKILIIIALCMLLIAINDSYAQGSGLNLDYPLRSERSSLQVIKEISGFRYLGTYTVSIDSAGTNTITCNFPNSTWDSTYYRNQTIVCYITPTGTSPEPIFFYYNPITYNSTVLTENVWVRDEISENWTTATGLYKVFIGNNLLPGTGIEITCINTGIASVSLSCEIYGGIGDIGQGDWDVFTRIDTLNGSDTVSFVFPMMNSGGMEMFYFMPDSINCVKDSLSVQIKPMIDYTTESAFSPITLDSLININWTDGVTYMHTLTDYLMPCPFVKINFIKVGAADTLGIVCKKGGYRK